MLFTLFAVRMHVPKSNVVIIIITGTIVLAISILTIIGFVPLPSLSLLCRFRITIIVTNACKLLIIGPMCHHQFAYFLTLRRTMRAYGMLQAAASLLPSKT